MAEVRSVFIFFQDEVKEKEVCEQSKKTVDLENKEDVKQNGAEKLKESGNYADLSLCLPLDDNKSFHKRKGINDAAKCR